MQNAHFLPILEEASYCSLILVGRPYPGCFASQGKTAEKSLASTVPPLGSRKHRKESLSSAWPYLCRPGSCPSGRRPLQNAWAPSPRSSSSWSDTHPRVMKMKSPRISGAPTAQAGGRNRSLPADVKRTAWVSGEENDGSPCPREGHPTR